MFGVLIEQRAVFRVAESSPRDLFLRVAQRERERERERENYPKSYTARTTQRAFQEQTDRRALGMQLMFTNDFNAILKTNRSEQ